MTELPTIETVRERVRGVTTTGQSDGPTLLAQPLDGSDPLSGVEREDGSYVGKSAARAGLLAAASELAAEGSVRLHDPEAGLTADGPWIVLEPLDGWLATVSQGAADVRVEIEREQAGVHETLAADEERLSAVLAAARPEHDHYPVEMDDDGVFTTGMTALSLADVRVTDETLAVAFDAATTPATTAAAIEERFAGCEGVSAVSVDRTAGVERAEPDETLRAAAKRAHVETVGDCEYAWLPAGSRLAEIPVGNKLALGTGQPGEPFDADAYENCVTLLDRTLAAMEGSA